MSKSKKFDAAEKHFMKLKEKLDKDLKYYKERCVTLSIENEKLKQEMASLEATIAQQMDWIERLLEYTELSQEDVKAACDKDKEMAGMLKMLNAFSGGLFKYV